MTPDLSKAEEPLGRATRDGRERRWGSGRWTRGFLLIAILLVVSYILAGFYLAPGLIRSQATAWVKTNLGKSLTLGDIKFNPFTFTLDVADLAIPDGNQPIVALGHLRIGFSILSLFQHAYYFREVRLDQPFVRMVVRPDHSLNLVELEPHTRTAGPSPALRIGMLSIAQGKIVYADHSQAFRPEKTLTPIAFTLEDFQTNRAEGGSFTLNGKSERGESFVWTGDISIAPIASQGHLIVAALQGDTIQKLAGEYLPIALTSGTIGFVVRYNFAYGDDGLHLDMRAPGITLVGMAVDGKSLFHGMVQLDKLDTGIGRLQFAANGSGITALRLTVPQVNVQGVRVIAAAATPDQTIKLANATLIDTNFDYRSHKVALGSLTLSGAELPLRRERNGGISLMALMPERPTVTPQTKPAAQIQAAPQAPAWNIGLGSFALDNATFRFEDRAVSPMVRVTVTPITLSVSGAGSDLTTPVSFQFDAKVNGHADIGAQGTVTPTSGVADMTIKLAKLAVRPFLAYLPPHPALDIKSGEVGASGTLHVEGRNLAAARFRGDAAMDNFSIYEPVENSELFAWRAFSFKNIVYDAKHVTIDRAHLTQPFGRIAMLANRTFNFQSLTGTNATTTPSEQTAATLPAPAQTSPAMPPVQFHMKRLEIANGAMSFADYSIQPNFEARIDALQGTVTNISNLPQEVATIDLKGQVIDRYSPVAINGAMNLLGYDRNTDMHLTFSDIELPVFNPYSGRYAGYAIAKGKLTTELSYKIENRALKADHHIIIDQLEWGQATDSKEAVPLPIRLATALLKDKDGVIDLDLPVTGSLDDPHFRIWPIVWQILGNVIEKAVTAPFRLIGALFAGAEKAQYVDFAPGSAVLPPGSSDALGALAKALAQRPELELDVPAAPAIQEDAFALADVQIDTQAMGDNKKASSASFIALDPGDQHDDLESLYKAKLGKKPSYPDFTPDALKSASDKSDLDDDDRRAILETQWLRTELRTAFAPSSIQLAALGAARAKAVRDALLADGTVDPARLFMAGALAAAAVDGHSRLELKIK